jgi:hypothetical protein
MFKKIPSIIDMYYSANVNKGDPELNILNLYETSKSVEISTKPESFSSVKFSKKIIDKTHGNKRLVYYDPPIGPLPPGSQCSYILCNKIGPIKKNKHVYHTKDCRTPVKEQLWLSKKGMSEFKNKINILLNNLNLTESEKEKCYNMETRIKYLLVFPKRGLGSKDDINKNKRVALENLITVSYKTKPLVGSEFYSKDHDDGFNIIIRISRNMGIFIVTAPYNHSNYSNFSPCIVNKLSNYFVTNDDIDDDKNSSSYYENVLEKAYEKKIIEDKSWITVLRGNYNILKDGYEINLEKLNSLLNSKIEGTSMVSNGVKYTMFKYKFKNDLSLISFHLVYKGLNFYIEIRLKGSVKITVSYGLKDQREYGIKFSSIKQIKIGSLIPRIDKQMLVDIQKFLHPIFTENEELIIYKIPKKIIDITRVQNMYKPPDYKRNTIIQPQICGGKNKFRPFPYSFKGNCANINEYVDDVGIHWKKASRETFNRYDLYEPCCKKITGTYSDGITFEDFKINDEKEIKNKIKRIGKNNGHYNDFIKNSEGNKKIFLRRLIYGFPNNLREIKNEKEMKSLFEDISKKLYTPLSDFPDFTVKDMDSPETYGIEKTLNGYVDNKAATYVPGTQLSENGGDGTLIREKRIFKGLKELLEKEKNSVIENIIKCYYSDYKIVSLLTPKDKNIIEKLLVELIPIKVLSECNKDQLNDKFVLGHVPKNTNYVKLICTNNNFFIIEETRGKENVILNASFEENNNINGLVMTGMWYDSTFYALDTIKIPDKNIKNLNYLTIKLNGYSTRNSYTTLYGNMLNEILSQYFSVKLVEFVEFSDIKNLEEPGYQLLFMSTDEVYSKTKIFNWFEGIEQYYMDKLIFNFKVDSCKKTGMCKIVSTDGKELKFIPKTIKIGIQDGNKTEKKQNLEFKIKYNVDSSGYKTINIREPFYIISKNYRDNKKSPYRFSSATNVDTYEETLYKICMIFKPINLYDLQDLIEKY